MDPRAANPSLGLSGGVISATFCIPHALQFTKGSEWVCCMLDCMFDDVYVLNSILGIETSTWDISPL
jgi:hypothetical protein